MSDFTSWSTLTDEPSGQHHLNHLSADGDKIEIGVEWAAALVPGQYSSPDRVATLLAKLGKEAAAAYVENKLPLGPRAQSGDLGEILGTEFAKENLGFSGVMRLRWKDHREMAMRGEDVIGVRSSETHTVEYLKGEVKSRVRLSASVVHDADSALRKDRGRPSPHALEFFADRLHEEGKDGLADLIDESLLVAGIKVGQINHLLFTFSGNDPMKLLRYNLGTYSGKIRQFAVGLEVVGHQAFIASVFKRVIANLHGH